MRLALMDEVSGPGGAEVLLLQMAEELRRRGHEVFAVLPCDQVGWLNDELLERGFEVDTFSDRSAFDVTCLRTIVKTLQRRAVDLVHSHEFAMAIYGTVATRWLGVPHVISMHGCQYMMERWRRRAALRWAIRHTASTIAVSEDTRLHLQSRLGLEAGEVRTILNGVAVRVGDAEKVRKEFQIAPSERLLLSVGSLVPRKGHIVLLRALDRLEKAGLREPWRLIIAGSGEERGALEAFVESHGLAGRVHLVGHRDDIPDLQAAADIFLMPSLWEGLPLAVLEAMLARTALVATDASGIPEAVESGVEGLLVPPGDEEALAAALRRLLEDDGLRQRIADAAFVRARANFTIERMTDDYEQVYSEARSTSSNSP